MSEEVFKSLSGSLSEAGEILRGETKEFREFDRVRGASKKSATALAVCGVSDDDDLISGKLYRVKILPSGNISVRDESGETVVCDASDFIVVEFKPAIEKRIRKIFDRVTV